MRDFGFDSVSSGGGGSTFVPAYGSFYDKNTQLALLGTNKPNYFILNETDTSSEISVQVGVSGQKTRFQVNSAGVYNIQFSTQLFRGSVGTQETIDIWLRKNEIDVPDSDTVITVRNNDRYFVAAWNFFVTLEAGGYCEIMYSVSTTQIQLKAEPQNLLVPHPAVPSIIVTMNKVG